jgi:hypothetical protein
MTPVKQPAACKRHPPVAKRVMSRTAAAQRHRRLSECLPKTSRINKDSLVEIELRAIASTAKRSCYGQIRVMVPSG